MKLTNELAQQIIDAVADGEGLRKTLKKLNVRSSQFAKFMAENPLLETHYGRAQIIRAELLVDEVIDIVDEEPDPNKARVRADARKWYASKMQPQKYGDRLDLNVNQTVDIGTALAEAKKRALPQKLDSEPERDVTPVSEDEDIFK